MIHGLDEQEIGFLIGGHLPGRAFPNGHILDALIGRELHHHFIALDRVQAHHPVGIVEQRADARVRDGCVGPGRAAEEACGECGQ
jgi:hypothetical protein